MNVQGSFSETETLFYHHTTAIQPWDSVFANVTYSVANDGTVAYAGGLPDVSTIDLSNEITQAINWYMTSHPASAQAINLSTSNVSHVDGPYATVNWPTAIAGKTSANMDAPTLTSVIAAFGESLSTSGTTLTSNNCSKQMNMYVVFELTIAMDDTEELHIQPIRTFSFYNGSDSQGSLVTSSMPSSAQDGSGAQLLGKPGVVRFCTVYSSSVP